MLIHGKTIFCRSYSFMYCIVQKWLVTIDLMEQDDINNNQETDEPQSKLNQDSITLWLG